jgi:hypothetical protein
MVEEMTRVTERLRHQQPKYKLYFGDSDIHSKIKKFNDDLASFGLHLSTFSETEQAERRLQLLDRRDALVALFREKLGVF